MEKQKKRYKIKDTKKLFDYPCNKYIDFNLCLCYMEKCSWKRDKTIDNEKIHVKISISH